MLFLYIAIWYDFIPDVIKCLCYTMAYKKKNGKLLTHLFLYRTDKQKASWIQSFPDGICSEYKGEGKVSRSVCSTTCSLFYLTLPLFFCLNLLHMQ